MLKLYHTPISPNSRRVWIALLEKQIPFELVTLNLDGDQLQPDFIAISPFHHIPVLVDDDFSIVESLAILDYLEAKYPTPAMLPTDAKALATVRMVELVTVNELFPAMNPLTYRMLGIPTDDPQKLEQAEQRIHTVLKFFEGLLRSSTYFGGSPTITLAELVAGTVVPWMPALGVPLDNYPHLSAWCERLSAREAWQNTQVSMEEVEAFLKPRFQQLITAQQNH
ncbi:glutathione S-transferase family protein [Argonema antarcticum]|uniref:glutathione S-transferase family protein n=1 Tax=Argonema antarcticum TaxID=2942763 RepID=UPI002011C680|nr:glutathione S-transferase family protein [Argonema antarcticum]MCL1471919.1 glutathione S-transferase family protein [Argonema antarcticum A004/B2]